jgi:gluconate 5-dehydrogenase
MTLINLNLNAIFFLIQEVGKRAFIPQRSGKIIVATSIAGLRGNPPNLNLIADNTSKGLNVNFVRAPAIEWGNYNINVNAIYSRFFPLRMADSLIGELGDQIIASTPLRRFGRPEDLNGLVVFAGFRSWPPYLRAGHRGRWRRYQPLTFMFDKVANL